ncbi:hypothetical protein [Chelatococcus sp.]|uniref:helix-turn-helix domain-containing protein n=1 Tax=Chelatococcus sp. TaxID=1953771 RepID=UPI0025BD8F5B|nr:hypothetical protein [Chelatococcus sp.]MBX3559710.1 helix-turn-helix domain-containing protein [Chelatococcus sp.]
MLQVLIPWPQEVRIMGKPTSSDLRERIVRGVASGQSYRAMAARFEVAPSTAVRIQQRYRATGVVAPARQGRPTGSGKLGAHRRVIIDKVKAQPDITMPDLAAWLEGQHGVTVDLCPICQNCPSELPSACSMSWAPHRFRFAETIANC